MSPRSKVFLVSIIAATIMTALVVMVWRRGASSPPVVTIGLLGYTNRVGPYALLAVTNRSQSAVTLNSVCLVTYRGSPYGPGTRMSIEENRLRVTGLKAQEGCVQEVFVFPAGSNGQQWQFEYYACYASSWLDWRRSAEAWVHKHIRRTKFPSRSATWHKFQSELFSSPP